MIPERVGPHRLLEPLASGPTSTVSLATDRSGRRVLFKVHEDDDALGELAALGVSHPGLSACLDAGRLPGDGRAYTVSEFVDGRPLGPDAGPLRGADLVGAAAWLLATLELLHERLGVLHRDVKADNVLVERSTGRPVLVDLGLAVPRDATDAPLSGTPRAMAPELFDGQPATVRSDLWAVGLLLAEAGLGRPLFEARDDPVAMAAERRDHAGLTPDELDALGGGDVAELVDRLLAADPQRRPSDAGAALSALSSLGAAEVDALDRARAAASLRAALARRDPRLASIREAVGDGAARVELVVDDALPDGGANGAVATVAALAGAVPEPSERLASRLAAAELRRAPARWDDVAGLVAALAEHGPLVCHVHGVGLDDERVRALAAVPGVLPRVSPPCTPDDLRDVLVEWLGDPRWLAARVDDRAPDTFPGLEAAATTLLTSGTVAVEAGTFALDETRLPDGWPSLADASVELAADERDVAAVLALVPGVAASGPALREVLDRSVGGTLERLETRGVVERRRSKPDDLHVLVDPCLRAALADGGELPDDVRRRVALRIADDAAGDDLGPDAAAAIVRAVGDVAPSEPDGPALTACLAAAADALRRVARLGVAASGLRRAIAGAPPERRAALEVDLADVLVRAQRYDDVLALADEARAAAGAEVPALVVRAARVRMLRGAPRDALDLLTDDLIAALDDEDAVLALQIRSQALQLTGDLDASLADVRAALRRQGTSPHRRTMVLLERAGALARRLGRPDEALERYEACLAMARELGHEILTGTTLQGMSLALRDTGRRRRALTLLQEAVERLEQAGDLSNLARASNSLGASLRTLGDVDGAQRHLARAITLARRVGDAGIEAMASSNTGLVLAALGRLDDADDAFARSLALRTARGDRVGQAAVALTRGPLRVDQGRVDDARDDLAAALEALGDLPAPHWRVEAHLLAARIALADGDERAAREAASAARERAAEQGLDREGVVAADLLARAAGLAADDLDDVDDGEGGSWVADLLTTRALLREADGDRAGADADFDRALGLLSATPDGAVEARLLVERASVDLARLERHLDRSSPDLGAVGDLVARIPRDTDRTRALVERLGLAPLRARLGDVTDRFGSLRHDGDVRGLAALAERVRDLERLTDVGKALNTERDTQRLLDLVIDSAIDLTGAARGFLILFDGGHEEIRAARNIADTSIHEPEFQISHSVAREVVRTGEALRTDNAIDDPRLASAASISELRLLSILCVPLVFRGRALGAVYVDHPQVVGRFEEKHFEIVRGLAEQAAIALENTRLSEGLKASNDELVASRAEVERLNEELASQLERREAELEEVRESLDASRRALGLRFDYSNIVTSSPAMLRVLDQLDPITDTDYPVIIQGESGTGKELIARAIHFNGPRGERNILSINCAAIAEPLIEAELFGAVKGAFTGADRDRKGLFEQADGGTLFLDEIGEMSAAVQSRLLRVLQNGEFLPVGGRTPRRVDVRVLCATHRDLREMVADKDFREDLYYRLAVATVRLPPLRERPDDVGLLAAHFIERHGGRPRVLEAEALALLRSYHWPGNVRQLENAVMNLLMFDRDGDVVTAEHARRILAATAAASPDGDQAEVAIRPEDDPERPYKQRIAAFERRTLRQALNDAGGNKARAARLLGVSARTLYKMLDRLDP